MLTRNEARTIALAHLPAAEPGIELVILDAHTIAKPYGWVFFYNSKKFVESGDFLDSTVGNGPMVVLHSGRCHLTTTGAGDAEQILAQFERDKGLA